MAASTSYAQDAETGEPDNEYEEEDIAIADDRISVASSEDENDIAIGQAQFLLDVVSEDARLQQRIRALPPEMQEAFMRELEQLYIDDMEDMCGFLGDSRLELKAAAEEIARQNELGEELDDVILARSKKEQKALAKYLKKRRKQEQKEFIPDAEYTGNDDEGDLIRRYVKDKQKAQKKELRKLEKADKADARKKREKDVEKNTAAALANVKSADVKMERERRRQKEKIKEEREKRKGKHKEKLDEASELFDELDQRTKTADHARQKEKAKQRDEIRKKLEDKKRKKRKEDDD